MNRLGMKNVVLRFPYSDLSVHLFDCFPSPLLRTLSAARGRYNRRLRSPQASHHSRGTLPCPLVLASSVAA